MITNAPRGDYRAFFGDYAYPKLANFFDLSEAGILIVKQFLDRDNENEVCGPLGCCELEICNISFQAVFESKGGDKNRYTVNVTVKLTDENDNYPQFPTSNLVLSIPEGDYIPDINSVNYATDIDSKKYRVIRYNLVDGTGTFSLVDSTKTSIAVTRPLDYESGMQNEFHLTLQAIDGGVPPKTGSITIAIYVKDINDNAPTFGSRRQKTIEIPESTHVGFILSDTPKATDLDSLPDNGRITYSFGGPTLKKIVTSKFAINGSTGAISIISPLDYEDYDQSFELPIIARDNGQPPLSSTATLSVIVQDVNDNSPYIDIHKNDSVKENSPPGEQVLSFYVRDKDKISHEKLICTPGLDKGLQLISLSATSFVVQTRSMFDYEKDKVLWLILNCKDDAIPKKVESFNLTVNVIDLNDNAPMFEQKYYSISILENMQPGTSILTTKATDKDEGQFGLISYTLNRQVNDYFHVDTSSGQIIVDKIIDREMVQSLTFTVTARDYGGLNDTAQVKIDILDDNDNYPELVGEPHLAVVENSPSGTSIGRVEFSDRDLRENGQVSLASGEFVNATVHNFIRLKPDGELVTHMAVDRETYANLFFVVIATDHGNPQLSTTVTLSIRVLDVNDHAPELGYPPPETTVGYSPGIYTNTPRGTKVVQLRGTDPDQAINSSIIYRMRMSNATGYFHMDPDKGFLISDWTESNSPREGLYQVEVELEDRGTPPQSTISRFYVNVGSASDNSGSIGAGGRSSVDSKSATLSNLVIVVLIVVLTVAVGSALIAAIVWARSRTSRNQRDSYPDTMHIKIPDYNNASSYRSNPPPDPDQYNHSSGTILKSAPPGVQGTVDYKAVGVSLSYIDPQTYTMSMNRHNGSTGLQTFVTNSEDYNVGPVASNYPYHPNSEGYPPPPPPHKSPRFSLQGQQIQERPTAVVNASGYATLQYRRSANPGYNPTDPSVAGTMASPHHHHHSQYDPAAIPLVGIQGKPGASPHQYARYPNSGMTGGVTMPAPSDHHSFSDSGRGASLEDMSKYQLTGGTSSFCSGPTSNNSSGVSSNGSAGVAGSANPPAPTYQIHQSANNATVGNHGYTNNNNGYGTNKRIVTLKRTPEEGTIC